MKFREALLTDIEQIFIVRFAVKENRLSDPSKVTVKACELYLKERGKGWVCEIDDLIVGFSIIDLVDNNVWALFILPEYENKGIGKKLHFLMLEWYFAMTDNPVWLGTDPGTRAEVFYQLQGWRAIGLHGNREIKFEMTKNEWLRTRKS